MKAVIFDMDYTLLDRESAIRTMANEHFAPYASGTPTLERMVESFVARDRAGFTHRQQVYAHVADSFNLDLPIADLVMDFDARAWSFARLFDGVGELLGELRRDGVKLAILTNGSAAAQNAKIDAAGLRNKVDVIFISGERGLWKPDLIAFRAVCNDLETTPTDTVMVGDTPEHDILPARELGMRTIWTVSHHAWPSGISLRNTPQVTTIREVAAALNRWSRKECERSCV